MRRFLPAIPAVCLFFCGVGAAHTHLVGSAPADHATLQVAPKEAVLTFAEPVILTAAKLDSAQGPVVLKPLPNGSVKEAHVPLPALAPGSYRLRWRATSDDGHVMSGELQFAVAETATK